MKLRIYLLRLFLFAGSSILTLHVSAADSIDTHIRLPSGPQYSWFQFAYWIDDETLMVSGFADNSMWTPLLPDHAAYRLEYSVSSRMSKNLGLIRSGGFCFDNGFIRYIKHGQEADVNTWTVYYGAYGKEMPLERKADQQPPHRPQRPTWDCRDESELLPEDLLYNGQYSLIHLHTEDGYIEHHSNEDGDVLQLHRPSGEVIPLTAFTNERVMWPVKYRVDQGAYMVRSINSGGAGEPRGFYLRWLYGDGRTEGILSLSAGKEKGETSLHLPSGAVIQIPAVNPYILPLSNGDYIFGAGSIGREGVPGFSGLYLLRQGRVIKLVDGIVSEIVVSPDGCKAAAGINSKSLANSDYFLHVVDDCHKDDRDSRTNHLGPH